MMNKTLIGLFFEDGGVRHIDGCGTHARELLNIHRRERILMLDGFREGRSRMPIMMNRAFVLARR